MHHLFASNRLSRSLAQQSWLCSILPRLPVSRVSARGITVRVDDGTQSSGTTTEPTSPSNPSTGSQAPASASSNPSPYHFLTGQALFAKRSSRPFPPPFLSLPSSSFSDPLSTHNRSIDKRRQPQYQGKRIRGVTNGDDAVLAERNMVAVGDGVGAWAQKERGHAALWSRLVLHFWAMEAGGTEARVSEEGLNGCLQKAYEATVDATSPPNEWFGTTTASGARLSDAEGKAKLEVTQLGDSAILVLRPKLKDGDALLYKTEEQWHWFDCPRQLGTNSPDTPTQNGVSKTIDVEEGDVVLAISDGVSDNLWEHEVIANVCDSVRKEEEILGPAVNGKAAPAGPATTGGKEDVRDTEAAEAMRRVATELVRAARVIAEDPFAESPFMERAIEEGLPTEGGKLDDISVVVGLCARTRPHG